MFYNTIPYLDMLYDSFKNQFISTEIIAIMKARLNEGILDTDMFDGSAINLTRTGSNVVQTKVKASVF